MNFESNYFANISNYNLWFVKLRYLAVAALFALIAIISFSNLELSNLQLGSIVAISILITFYNFLFGKVLKNDEKNDLTLSLVQILFDLISLSILTYFTGGIESPFIYFFIFHMIIGSLLLPKRYIYSIAIVIIILLSFLTCLEYFNVIPHQTIAGLSFTSSFDEPLFVITTLTVVSVTLLVSIFITTKIVSDLYTREAQLENALLDLELNEEAKQKYIAGVVHELKSPISAANSLLEIVTGGYSGKIDEEAHDKIKRSEARLQQAIGDINKVLRISQFKLNREVEKNVVDIKSLIENEIANKKELLERKNINVDIKTSDNYESALLGDEVLLQLVFSNIISNAIKYNIEGGSILVELISNDRKTIIKVSDTGIGILIQELDKITLNYYRSSNAKERGIEGTGTGLSFVKEIIHNHNGRLKIKSPSKIGDGKNRGTSIIIALQRG